MKFSPIKEKNILSIRSNRTWLLWLALVCFPIVAQAENILDKKVTVYLNDVTIEESLDILSKKSGCHFAYSNTLLNIHRKVTTKYVNISLRNILLSLFENKLSSILVEGNTVLLITITITGRVIDSKNIPIPFASVVLKGTKKGTTTDRNGIFKLNRQSSITSTITISAIGYKDQVKKIKAGFKSTPPLTFKMEESVEQLNEVLVTANGRKTTSTATRSLTPIKDLPMPIMLIEGKQLEMMGSRRLNEVLQEQTGLALTTDPSGASSSLGLQVQGFDASYTMIMIDGQPLIGRNSTGILDLTRITVANIDRIEIIKGTSSAMYGSDALAGVVNIITKGDINQGTQGVTAVRYGTNNTLDATLDASSNIIKDKMSAYVSANYYNTNGYDSDASTPGQTLPPFYSYSLQGKLNYNFDTSNVLKTSLRYASRNQHNNYDLDLLGKREDNNIEKDLTATVLMRNKIAKKTQLQTQYYFTKYDANSTSFDPDSNTELSSNKFRQYFHRFESYANTEFSKKITLTTGLGVNAEILDATRYGDQKQMNNSFAYVQVDYKPFKKLGLLSGLRYDIHSIYGNQLSPRFGIRYTVNNNLILKGTAGTGFKAPSFQQLYLSFTNPSAGYTVLGASVFYDEITRLQDTGEIRDLFPISEEIGELKAEHSLSFNLGFMWMPTSHITLEVNSFHNNINNMIFEELVGMKENGSQLYSYRNIEEAFTQGLETNLKWTVIKGLDFSAGYQLLYTKDRGIIEDIKAGNTQIRTPEGQVIVPKPSDYFNLSNRSRNMFNAKVFYEYKPWGLSTSLRANYRGKYGIGDRNYPNNFIDPYDLYADGHLLLNSTIEKRFLKDKFSVQFICDNITGYNDNLIPNLPGRQFLVSLSWRFNSDKNNND